jgi:hypothetical protein
MIRHEEGVRKERQGAINLSRWSIPQAKILQ